jgi:hypothetical protein
MHVKFGMNVSNGYVRTVGWKSSFTNMAVMRKFVDVSGRRKV